MIVGFVLGALTKGIFFLIEMPINLLLMVGGFCLWGYLMYSAYQRKTVQASRHRRACCEAGWLCDVAGCVFLVWRRVDSRAHPGHAVARPILMTALVLCFAASGCRHSESHVKEVQHGPPGALRRQAAARHGHVRP